MPESSEFAAKEEAEAATIFGTHTQTNTQTYQANRTKPN